VSYSLVGLVDCGRLKCRPSFIPRSRPKGLKGKGLSYERKVGKVLNVLFSHVHSGAWFRYSDRVREGVCQIDHYVCLGSYTLLIECKLSENQEAWEQMKSLYAPILEQYFGVPVARVQATRHLRTGRKLILDPREARPGQEALWHVLV
jgi:hypothetical protein